MDSRPIVALDMDDVLYEFVIPLLDKYNLRYDDYVRYEDITDWNIQSFLKPECKDVFEEFVTEGFFEELFVPASTAGWLSVLSEIADIRFITAGCAKTIPWRAELLKRELDFFEDKMLVKLRDKWLLKCDYFVDDNTDNVNGMCIKSKGQTTVFQVKRPWNGEMGYDTNEALAKIARKILRRESK